MAKWKPPQKAKRDANEPLIVDALKACGVYVQKLDQPVDLLCCYRGRTFLAEVKNPDARGKPTRLQTEFLANWPGDICILETPEDAFAYVAAMGAVRQ